LSTRVFFLNRLKSGIEATAYEAFVRDVDYPRAKSVPAILDYSVFRLQPLVSGSPTEFDYVETVDVADFEAYRSQLLSAPGRDGFIRELRALVEAEALIGTRIPPR